MDFGRMAGDTRTDEVVLSVLRSKQVVLDGQDRLDRLAGLAVKFFTFSQVVENAAKRE